jgi:hypothetical protein
VLRVETVPVPSAQVLKIGMFQVTTLGMCTLLNTNLKASSTLQHLGNVNEATPQLQQTTHRQATLHFAAAYNFTEVIRETTQEFSEMAQLSSATAN